MAPPNQSRSSHTLTSFSVPLGAESNGNKIPLTARLINMAEEERKHLARELHDDIGQRLSLVAVNLDVLKNEAGFEDSLREKLKNALRELQELAADVHNLSHRLHSSKLQHLGLPLALKEVCRQLASQHHLEIDLESNEATVPLQEEVSLCFYRVAQEALNNAIKHSHSKRVKVHLDHDHRRVRLQVKDFGVGFDPATRVEGLGLATMQERLKMIGGTLSIRSVAGRGTELSAEALVQGGQHPRGRGATHHHP
jgi:signal transduction histidine kinase